MPSPKKVKTAAGAAKRPAASPKPLAKAPRETKQDHVLRLLRRKAGATIAAIMEATGWQQHSVRGFFSAVVRKRLGLTLILEGEPGKRRYRIVDEPAKTGGKR